MLKMDNKSAKEDVIVKNKGSLIQTIKSFERCMADMKSTVLVPTRLNDIDSQTMAKSGVNCIRSDNENLYNVYNDLQKISKLLYGDRHQSDLKYANPMDLNGNSISKSLHNECLPKDDNLLTKLDYHVRHMRVILNELCGTAGYITNVYKEDVQNMHMNYNHIEYNNSEIKHYYTSNSSNDPIS